MATTIGHRILSRGNNCDIVRLAAAWMVMLSHSWAFLGRGADEPLGKLLQHDNFGSTAVAAFLILSGLLVTGSFLGDPHPGRYALRRALRIYPGLFVNVLVSILVIGALATTLPIGPYLASSRTWNYLANAMAWRQVYDLPGVFKDHPVPTVNGSLWTLRSELNMYVLLLVLGVTRLLRPGMIAVLLATVLIAQSVIVGRYVDPNKKLLGIPFEISLWHTFYFFAGALLFLLRDRVTINWPIFALCVVVMALAVGHEPSKYVYRLLLPYVVIGLALSSSPLTSWLRRTVGDLSYGTFLYAFPLQQWVLQFGGTDMPLARFLIISTVATLLVAAASWHLVEKPMMKLKRKARPTAVPSAIVNSAAGSD